MIKLINVTKRFRQGTSEEIVALDNVSLEVENGEFITVVGSNGSGKTTLLNIIAGSIKPDYGHVMIEGKYTYDKPEHVCSEKIARIFQDANLGILPGMTIEENLSIAQVKGNFPSPFRLLLRSKRKNEAREVLSTFNMGLDDRLGVPIRTLSGGQRQAVAISMAVLSKAQIFLMDEHTASLDPRTAPVIMRRTDEIIRERRLTAIMVTHDLHLALSYGSRLVLMHRGKIVKIYDQEEKTRLTDSKLLKDFATAAGDELDSGLAFSSRFELC